MSNGSTRLNSQFAIFNFLCVPESRMHGASGHHTGLLECMNAAFGSYNNKLELNLALGPKNPVSAPLVLQEPRISHPDFLPDILNT